MKTAAKGGQGSNQYVTRGQPAPRRRDNHDAIAAAVTVGSDEIEAIAWGFHPERQEWVTAGFSDDAEMHAWRDKGIGPVVAGAWRYAGWDPDIAFPWIDDGIQDPGDVRGKYACVITHTLSESDPDEPDHPVTVTFAQQDCVARYEPDGRIVFVSNSDGVIPGYQAPDNLVSVVHLDPYTDRVPPLSLSPKEAELIDEVLAQYRPDGHTRLLVEDYRNSRATGEPILADTVRMLALNWREYWSTQPALSGSGSGNAAMRVYDKLDPYGRW